MLNISNLFAAHGSSGSENAEQKSYTFKHIFVICISLLSIFSVFFLAVYLATPQAERNSSHLLLLSTVFTTATILLSMLLVWLFHRDRSGALAKYTAKSSFWKDKKLPFSLTAVSFWSVAVIFLLVGSYAFSHMAITFFCVEDAPQFIIGMSLMTTALMDLISVILAVITIKLEEETDSSGAAADDSSIPLRTVVRWCVCIIGSVICMFAFLVRYLLPLTPWYEETPVLKMAMAVTVVAIPLQVISYVALFQKSKTPSKKFLVFPQVRTGVRLLALQFVLNVILMLFSEGFPFEAALALEVMAIGLSIVLFNLNDITRVVIETQEKTLEKNTHAMQDIIRTVSLLPRYTDDAGLKDELARLADDFRYSDPVSTKKTVDRDNEMLASVKLLEKALINSSLSDEQVAVLKRVNETYTKEQILDMCQYLRFKLEQRNQVSLSSQ